MHSDMQYLHNYMLSEPVKVFFCGFESNTLALQQNGWELSLDQRDYFHGPERTLHLVAKHQIAGVYLWCHPTRFDPYSRIQDIINRRAPTDSLAFHVAHISPEFKIKQLVVDYEMNFKPIDARPQMSAIDGRSRDFGSMEIFKSVNVSEDFEIFLNKKDEAEILDILLEKQVPRQKEIRDNKRRDAFRESSGESVREESDISRQLIIVAG